MYKNLILKAPKMPKKLAHHCAAIVGDHIYVHGGFELPDIPNYDTFVLNLHSRQWKTISSRPNCGQPLKNYTTTCAIWKGVNLVVPTFDTKTMKCCTAILNLKSEKWTQLKEDKRNYIVGGQILK